MQKRISPQLDESTGIEEDQVLDSELQESVYLEPATDTEPVESIVGAFDGFEGLHVCGWARDDANPQLPVTVEVMANNRWVASGRAELFRADLLAAGIGKGTHAFRIPLPAELCDGGNYDITVRAGSNGAPLRQDPHIFQQAFTLFGHVDGLDGPFVVGSVRNPLLPDSAVQLELRIDGQ